MLVQFGNNWMKKFRQPNRTRPRTDYFEIGQHVVLLHIQIPHIHLSLNVHAFWPKNMWLRGAWWGGVRCNPPPPPQHDVQHASSLWLQI